MTNLIGHQNEANQLNWSYYKCLAKEGMSFIFQEGSLVLRERYRLIRKSLIKHQKSATTPPVSSKACHQAEEDDSPASILYLIRINARLAAMTGLVGPSHILDIRHGVHPIKKVVYTSYALSLFGFIVGSIVASIVVQVAMAQILPGLIPNLYRLISTLVWLTGIAFISYGMFNVAYMMYQRQFIREFFLYRCNVLRIRKSTQRRRAFSIFITNIMMALCTDGLFVMISLFQDFKQPNYLPNVNWIQFSIIKIAVVASASFGAMILGSLGSLLGNASRMLSLLTANHLKELFERQMARLNYKSRWADDIGQVHHNQHLVSLVDQMASNVMTDYLCDTLTMDWPSLETFRQSGGLAELDKGGPGAIDRSQPDHQTQQIGMASTCNRQQLGVPAFCRLMSHGRVQFIYKNLSSNLSEIKEMISLFEQRFGLFHCVHICIYGLILAQWVVAGVTQMKLFSRRYPAENETGQAITPFVYRTGVTGVMFFVTNTISFMSFDCLRSLVDKIESQMFKINVDLALTWMNYGQDRQTITEFANEQLVHLWASYDHLVRLGGAANFRLTPNTWYHKKCIVSVIGREISFVLFYAQLIDIYVHL